MRRMQRREALALSAAEHDEVTEAQAACCLGDLLFEQGRYAEARPFLERVIGSIRVDDVLAFEVRRARELLTRLS